MVWINSKTIRFFLPYRNDELIRCETFEGFKSLGKVIGIQEIVQMLLKMSMGLIIVPFDGSLLEGTVHAFDLTIRPRMTDFG